MKSLQVFLDIISTSFAMYNWVLSSAQEPFAMLRMRKRETGNPEKRPSGQAPKTYLRAGRKPETGKNQKNLSANYASFSNHAREKTHVISSERNGME